VAGHRGEVHVLEVRLGGFEPRAGRLVAVDVHDGAAREQLRGDDGGVALERRELGSRDDAPPEAAAQVGHRARGLRLEEDAPPVDDREAGAQLGHVLDDVRGEDDDAVLPELAEQVEEAHALGGVEPRGRLVDDHQLGAAEQGDGDAEALLHAAGVAAELLAAHVPEVHLAEECLHGVPARAPARDPLEQREVVEQLLGAHVRVQAELLGEVAQGLPNALGSRRTSIAAPRASGPSARRRGAPCRRPRPGGWRGCA
jgi:hypothetical protein